MFSKTTLSGPKPILKLKVNFQNYGEEFYFKAPENDESELIWIGRHSKCHVKISNAVLSKIQCFVRFQDDARVIGDGDGLGKNSMNGTWLYCQEEFVLQHG